MLNKMFKNPQELDLFELETKSRRTIGELFKPVLEDRDKDRKNVATLEITVESLHERIY